VKDIAAAGHARQGLLLARPQPLGKVGDGRLRLAAAWEQFQEPHAPGIAVAMRLEAEEVAISRAGIDPNQDGIAGLKDLVVSTDFDAGQVFADVDLVRGRDGAVDDVVGSAQRHSVSEEVSEQLDDAAQRAVANEDQGKDELANPRARYRQVEQDLFGILGRLSEGLLQSVVGKVKLLVDELAADSVLLGEVRDGRPGKGVEGDLLALLGCEMLSRAEGRVGLVVVVGQSYDAQGRDLRRTRVVGATLDLRDPGSFACAQLPLQRPNLLPSIEPGLCWPNPQVAGSR
jgi:hypothetical protein